MIDESTRALEAQLDVSRELAEYRGRLIVELEAKLELVTRRQSARREMFAAHALSGMMASQCFPLDDPRKLVAGAFQLADAMMAEADKALARVDDETVDAMLRSKQSG